MEGRPSSSRPSTSARPTTAFDRDQFQYLQHHLQQQQPHEIEEASELEEESDDEDVFAFLPPSTADQEQQSPSQSPFTFAALPYPEPTFDPWGRQFSMSPTSAPPLPPGITGIPSQTHSLPHPYYEPPLSSHSLASESHPSTGMSGPDFSQSSSFQHATGPSHSHSLSNSQSRRRQNHAGTGVLGMPQTASSLADSFSMSQSKMDDSEGRSIKWVEKFLFSAFDAFFRPVILFVYSSFCLIWRRSRLFHFPLTLLCQLPFSCSRVVTSSAF